MVLDVKSPYILIPVPEGWEKFRWLGEVKVAMKRMLDLYKPDHDEPMFKAIQRAREAVDKAQVVERF